MGTITIDNSNPRKMTSPAIATPTSTSSGAFATTAPATRRHSSVDLLVVALALCAVAASTFCTVAALDGAPAMPIDIEDEEVLIPWKKARPRGPPRFGKRAYPPFYTDADMEQQQIIHGPLKEPLLSSVSAKSGGALILNHKRDDIVALRRDNLPESIDFLHRLYRLDDAIAPIPLPLRKWYSRFA